MPSTAIVKFSDADESLLTELARERKGDLSHIAKLEPREVLADIKRCVSVEVKLEGLRGPIAARLGCLMARVAKEKLYELGGYDSLKDFETGELEDKGISHQTIWRAKRIFEWAPDLPIEDYALIGPGKLTIAASACKDASPAQKKKLLAKAKESPSVEIFRTFVEKTSGLSEPGATTGAAFELIGSAAEIKELKEWLANEQFREFAGDDRPIAMILAACQESSSVFPNEEEAPKKGKKEDW